VKSQLAVSFWLKKMRSFDFLLKTGALRMT